MAVSFTIELTCERPVSMIGVAPDTVTVSARPATAISSRRVNVWPTDSLTSG